ncbi:MAG: hypothetical protein AABX86_00260 [Nanoarchaeota archaeon]
MTHPTKPSVEFKEEPLRYLCNESFFGLRKLFPEHWNDGNIAYIEGLIGGYFLADAGTSLYGEAAVLPNINQPTFSRDTELQGIVKGSLLVEGIYSLIAPKKLKQFWNENPIYSRGALGTMIGASARGIQQLL